MIRYFAFLLLCFMLAVGSGVAALVAGSIKHARKEAPALTMWPPLYWFFVSLFRIAFRLNGGIRIVGRENLPASGGYIVAANHISHADPPVVGCALPRPAYFMAKADLFEAGLFGKTIPLIGAFPVHRGSADRAAVKKALDLLQAGEIVVIFPEGTRRPVGALGDPEGGFGWIALRTQAPVIPVAIVGTADVLPPGSKKVYRRPVTVHIGAPVEMDDLRSSRDTRSAIRLVGERTMRRIQELLDVISS